MFQSPTSRNEQGALPAAPPPITTAGLLQFLDIAPDALLVIDRAGTITMVNELDVMMPKVNGWQILHQLKTDPATANIPVVMLTVLSDQSTGYVLGADEYVTKPFKNGALHETIQRVVLSKLPARDRELEQQQV